MNLLVSFDDINARGNKFIYDHLSSEFKTTLVDIGDLKNHLGCKCFFTNSIAAAQEVNNKIPTILYINDYTEIYTRGDDVSIWRQNILLLKKMYAVYACNGQLAGAIFGNYRISCKLQYPCIPIREKTTQPQNIVFNYSPLYLSAMKDLSPREEYKEFVSEDDFKNAKLYIHTPDKNEQWHINIILAHTYGVPCITYSQGRFFEFCTNGDKLVDMSSGVKGWMNGFKIALRDCTLNSRIVYEMSQRFHNMNDIKQKIRKTLISNGFAKPAATFSQAQESITAIKKLQTRKKKLDNTFTQKIIRPRGNRGDYANIAPFLNNNNVLVSTGGLGDAAIVLAAALKENCKIIFGSSGTVRETVKQLFDTFEVESLMVNNFNGSIDGLAAWNSIIEHNHCQGSVHIPLDLNYGDWAQNPKVYLDRITKKAPFVKTLGKLINLRDTKKVIGVCPRGSDHNSTWKQRYLTKDEYNQLIKKLLSEDATVIVFGSEQDFQHYGIYQNNKVLFMTSNYAVSHPAPKYPITMRHMLTAIHGCDIIISMDTWLKTYAAIANIPCKVIMNRYFGKSTLDYADPSDSIFLNPDFWGFEVAPLNTLL